MRKTLYAGLLAIAAALTACDDYLSKNPNVGGDEVLNKPEQIDAIFGNSLLLQSYAVYSLSSSDDFGWTTGVMDQVPYPDAQVFNGIAWDIKGIEAQKSGDEVWSTEYTRIFYANLIINEIDKVEGLTPDNRTDFLAQAHFLRALANWELVSLYCRPYAGENLSTPGLPLKQTTSYEEDQQRATLGDTYKFIENDLKEALATTRTDIEKRWLVSRPAVEAMLSRFYLFTGQYQKAADCADEALKSTVARLTDYNSLQQITISYGGDDGGLETSLLYPEYWGYSAAQYTDREESYFSTVYRAYESAYLYPSESLISIYDKQHDQRFRQFFVKGGMKENGIDVSPDYCYHTFKSDWQGPIMAAGPTVAEVLLNKAEAQARLGQYQEAIQTVNLLRVKRISPDAPDVLLTASTQQEAIMKILEERHREMPFIMRWQDIRRLSYNETQYDDITPVRTFYAVSGNQLDYNETKTYALPLKSPRYALPLATVEIKRSGNQLVQNEY